MSIKPQRALLFIYAGEVDIVSDEPLLLRPQGSGIGGFTPGQLNAFFTELLTFIRQITLTLDSAFDPWLLTGRFPHGMQCFVSFVIGDTENLCKEAGIEDVLPLVFVAFTKRFHSPVGDIGEDSLGSGELMYAQLADIKRRKHFDSVQLENPSCSCCFPLFIQ